MQQQAAERNPTALCGMVVAYQLRYESYAIGVGVWWTSFAPFPYLMCHLYPFISNEKKKDSLLCVSKVQGERLLTRVRRARSSFMQYLLAPKFRARLCMCVLETSLFGGVSFRRFRVAVAILECYKRRADHQKWQAMAS